MARFQDLPNPIVFVLHLGYGWLGFGYLLLGLSGLSVGLKPAEAIAPYAAGAMGVAILGVMTRATLGHTGREIKADIPAVWAYGLVAAARWRVLTPLLPMDSTEGYGLSAVFDRFWAFSAGLRAHAACRAQSVKERENMGGTDSRHQAERWPFNFTSRFSRIENRFDTILRTDVDLFVASIFDYGVDQPSLAERFGDVA